MSEKTVNAIEIPDFITVRELSELMNVSPINVIKELMSSGIMANINQQIDFETAAIVAEEMGFEPIAIAVDGEDPVKRTPKAAWRRALDREKDADLVMRPPVVTMLGHVDHGKTSLLDLIRAANVQEDEAGGITQHIGAYQATHEGQLITFLDTPGHEAFTAMRARGAQATDIAILVIAADDGVMPQTREAADHARAAGVPIIVALNKIDLPNANPNKVRQQLAEIGLTPDDWDGDTLIIPVSAKEKLGIEDLLEGIILTAEELQPRANPQAKPIGTVIEARLERGRGVMATLLVQNGTLKLGDTILAGDHYGRIKAMYDSTGQRVKEAKPSTPVSVSGMNGMPEAGEQFETIKSEKLGRKIVAELSAERLRNVEHVTTVLSLDDFFLQLQEGKARTLNLIVKADVQGSLEPLVESLKQLSNDDVEIEILLASTGDVNESDVNLAAASNAVIVGFNAETDAPGRAAASRQRVEINNYRVIYHLLEDVEKSITGMLEPVYEPVTIGKAEVREVFRIRGVGNVAGCFMRSGEGRRNAKARITRGEEVIHEGEVSSLKHLKDNVREVKTGFEFGVDITNFNSYKVGDEIEFYVIERQR